MTKMLLLAAGLAFAGTAAHAQAPAAKSAKATKVAGPQIEFSEVKYDFGTIKQGDIVDHTFSFKNVGTQPLLISNITASCGCTTPTYTKEPVMPGKTGTISAKFNSAGKSGMQNKVLTIDSNSAAGTTSVALVGEVKEAATASK